MNVKCRTFLKLSLLLFKISNNFDLHPRAQIERNILIQSKKDTNRISFLKQNHKSVSNKIIIINN